MSTCLSTNMSTGLSSCVLVQVLLCEYWWTPVWVLDSWYWCDYRWVLVQALVWVLGTGVSTGKYWWGYYFEYWWEYQYWCEYIPSSPWWSVCDISPSLWHLPAPKYGNAPCNIGNTTKPRNRPPLNKYRRLLRIPHLIIRPWAIYRQKKTPGR